LENITKKLSIYFLNGILVLLPVVGTIYLLVYLYKLINSWGFYFLRIPREFQIPGLGFLFVILFVLLVGFIAKLWITNKIIQLIEHFIGKVPFVKGIYSTLKETIHSFIGEKRSFDTVVLVSTDFGKRLGFLTVKNPIFKLNNGKKYLGVYLPHSMQISGNLFWIEEEKIEKVDLSIDEAFKIILSAGTSGRNRKTTHQIK